MRVLAIASRFLLPRRSHTVFVESLNKTVHQSQTAIRGWLPDEGCACGRAESGTFPATNPMCAKDCVAKGKKIVLIDPDRKMIFEIANQNLAKKNIGAYVEIGA